MTLQHTATCCNILHHTAQHYSTFQTQWAFWVWSLECRVKGWVSNNSTETKRTGCVSGRAGQGVAEGVRRWQLCHRQRFAPGITHMKFISMCVCVRVCTRVRRRSVRRRAEGGDDICRICIYLHVEYVYIYIHDHGWHGLERKSRPSSCSSPLHSVYV